MAWFSAKAQASLLVSSDLGTVNSDLESLGSALSNGTPLSKHV